MVESQVQVRPRPILTQEQLVTKPEFARKVLQQHYAVKSNRLIDSIGVFVPEKPFADIVMDVYYNVRDDREAQGQDFGLETDGPFTPQVFEFLQAKVIRMADSAYQAEVHDLVVELFGDLRKRFVYSLCDAENIGPICDAQGGIPING